MKPALQCLTHSFLISKKVIKKHEDPKQANAWFQGKKVVPDTLPHAVLLPDAIEPVMLFYDVETGRLN